MCWVALIAACGDDDGKLRVDPSLSIPVVPEAGAANGDGDAGPALDAGRIQTGDPDDSGLGEMRDAAALDAATEMSTDAASANDAALPPMADNPKPPGDGGVVELIDAGPLLPRPDAGAPEDDDDAGPPPPPRRDCMGKPGAPGDTTHMYMDRAYIVHVPPNVYPDTAIPVMLVFHGAGGNGADMQTATAFDAYADQLGFVTIYPNGATGNAPWNVGRGACPPGGFISTFNDDISYVENMLNTVEADQCIARNKVFVTGFSMGGYMAHELGCRIGGSSVRAIAPHSGGTHSGDCPGAPIPVLILHGDADPLIDYSCAESARDYWVERNGCGAELDSLQITGGRCDFNRGCPSEAAVALCTFAGLEHNWGYPPSYEFSSFLITEFFAPLF
jgi:poly(3-hydroxybutyrate) depolymerase